MFGDIVTEAVDGVKLQNNRPGNMTEKTDYLGNKFLMVRFIGSLSDTQTLYMGVEKGKAYPAPIQLYLVERK